MARFLFGYSIKDYTNGYRIYKNKFIKKVIKSEQIIPGFIYLTETLIIGLKNDFKVSLPGEVYSQLCHSQPVFNKYKELVLNDPKDQFPGAEYVSNQQICLPLYPDLRVDELMYVVDSLRSVLDSLN